MVGGFSRQSFVFIHSASARPSTRPARRTPLRRPCGASDVRSNLQIDVGWNDRHRCGFGCHLRPLERAREQLRAAIHSVRGQACRPLEVILVVDHNPALKAWAESQFADIGVVANLWRPGAMAARNTGVRVAKGDIVAFLDDDATADPTWLSRLREHYADDKVIAVGGDVIGPVWSTRRPRWLPTEFDWVVGCSYRGLPQEPAPVRNLIGCNMSFRRSVFERAGGFREGLGRDGDNAAGCEETEFFIRATGAFPGTVVLTTRRCGRSSHRGGSGRVALFQGPMSRRGALQGAGRGQSRQWGWPVDERAHALRVLPAGVAREMATAVTKLDGGALMRAGAIVAGLAFVTFGYASGLAARRREGRSASQSFRPLRVLDLDLASALPDLDPRDFGEDASLAVPSASSEVGASRCGRWRSLWRSDLRRRTCGGCSVRPRSMIREAMLAHRRWSRAAPCQRGDRHPRSV